MTLEGGKHIGLSATSKQQEYFSAEVQVRNDIVGLLTERRQYRRSRRNRKTRYRKARYLNRVNTKKKGWLAPSIQHKIQTHLHVVKKIQAILPIQTIIVETASFDTQKLKNPMIQGVDYQQGDQVGFFNVREYVLFRDGHQCKNPTCKNKEKNKILEVHHLEK